MNDELLFRTALHFVPQIGDIQARELITHCGSASAVFNTAVARLEKIPGIGRIRANNIRRFNNFARAEAEISFMQREGIRPVFFTDADYPPLLLHCADAPVLLFCKGKALLNPARSLSIIGTRNNTAAGKHFTEALIAALAPCHVTIISGLAYGIDAIAHRAALQHNLPTIGILAHSLDRVYPYTHRPLAAQMLHNGALLSDFCSGTQPDKQNFPRRNRIVAGMAHATVVIETDMKGGSMITAELANSYNRDVFAVPGRPSDNKSAGCNWLIQTNRAQLLRSADDIVQGMGWNEAPKQTPKPQRELFVQLSPDETTLMDVLKEEGALHIDELQYRCRLSGTALAAALLNLELKGLVRTLAGKRYEGVD